MYFGLLRALIHQIEIKVKREVIHYQFQKATSIITFHLQNNPKTVPKNHLYTTPSTPKQFQYTSIKSLLRHHAPPPLPPPQSPQIFLPRRTITIGLCLSTVLTQIHQRESTIPSSTIIADEDIQAQAQVQTPIEESLQGLGGPYD